MKKLLAVACLAVLVACPAVAGEGHDHSKHAGGAPDMAAIKAEMMKCAVCKNYAPHMEEIMPVMKSEVVALDHGMAITHTITDPSKVATWHEVMAGMSKAGEACMAMSDADRKAALCDHCESFTDLMKAGATMSNGNTKDGSLMVLTSSDPALQEKIAETRMECAKMMGM